MGIFRIRYESGIFGGWVKLFINGKKKADLYRDETKSFELENGKYALQLKQVMISSPKKIVEISDEELLLVARNSTYLNMVNIFSLVLLLIHFLIAEPLGFVYLLYPAIALFILNIYNLIFRWNEFYYIEILESSTQNTLNDPNPTERIVF